MPVVGPIGEPLAPMQLPTNWMLNDLLWTKEQAILAGINMKNVPIQAKYVSSFVSGFSRGANNIETWRWPGNTDGQTRPYLAIPYRWLSGAHQDAGARQIISESFDLITADVGGCIRFVDDSEVQAHNYWIRLQDDDIIGSERLLATLECFQLNLPRS